MKGQKDNADHGNHSAAEVDKTPAPGIRFLVISRTDLFSDKDAGRAGKAAEEADDHSLKRAKDGSGGDGLVNLMAQDNADHHVSDADKHLIEDDGETLDEIVGDKGKGPAEMASDLKHIGDFVPENQEGHHGDIDQTGNDGSQCGPLDAHGGEAEFAENQDIIAQTVCDDADNPADHGNFHPLNGAQKGRHGRGDDLKGIGKADNPQVENSDGPDLGAVRVNGHDQVRAQNGKQRKKNARDHHEREGQPIGTADAVVIPGTPVLCKEQHSSADKSPVAGKKERGKLRAQAHGAHTLFPERGDHHGIHHRKRSKINVHFRHKPNPNTRGNYHVHTSEAACLSRIFRS